MIKLALVTICICNIEHTYGIDPLFTNYGRLVFSTLVCITFDTYKHISYQSTV